MRIDLPDIPIIFLTSYFNRVGRCPRIPGISIRPRTAGYHRRLRVIFTPANRYVRPEIHFAAGKAIASSRKTPVVCFNPTIIIKKEHSNDARSGRNRTGQSIILHVRQRRIYLRVQAADIGTSVKKFHPDLRINIEIMHAGKHIQRDGTAYGNTRYVLVSRTVTAASRIYSLVRSCRNILRTFVSF